MKNNFVIIFTFTGLLIGLLFAWQFQSNIIVAGNFPTDEVEAKNKLLDEYLEEQSYLSGRITFLRNTVNQRQEEIVEQSSGTNLAILNGLKAKSGLDEVNGPGIEIVLDDGKAANRLGELQNESSLVQASDLRDIANLLFASNADAVAINNQRITATSTISSIGTTILINNNYIAPPFIITAVGDGEIMLQRLFNRDLLPSIYERSEKLRLMFEMRRRESIYISGYSGNIKYNNINLVK